MNNYRSTIPDEMFTPSLQVLNKVDGCMIEWGIDGKWRALYIEGEVVEDVLVIKYELPEYPGMEEFVTKDTPDTNIMKQACTLGLYLT